MRVKYVYNWGFFHPPGSGADLVAANHVAYLTARGWDVDCLIVRDPRRDHAEAAFRAEYGRLSSLTLTDPPGGGWSLGDQLFAFDALANRPAVRDFLAAPADAFLTNYVFTAPLVSKLPAGCRRVLESVDVMCDQFALADRRPDGRPFPAGLARARTAYNLRAELDLYRLFDAVLMINRDEYDRVRRFGAANAVYVPRWCEPPADAGGEPAGTTHDLLFVASANPINRAGIEWFYRHVFVRHLWRRGVRLAIAGGVCGLLDIADTNVTLLGVVDGSLAPVYRSAAVVVAPIFEGTGLSIKTVEALAMGKAMIGAPAAARGLDPRSGAFLTLDMKADPAATADTILDLLADPVKRRTLEQKAAAYARREFGRETFFAAMDRAYQLAGFEPAAELRARSA
ncbi:MAG TPA: glycosyltransferase [Fimbriiglobus sp.]|jgi:glycosyltransferase involved in cell wall biosynthesis|nr:glycosyltransferase [Fimbriiglobus sp.]